MQVRPEMAEVNGSGVRSAKVTALPRVPQDTSGVNPTLRDVLVAIPAFNEERFIGSVVLQTRLAGYSVLVVDDGSADSTADVAAAAGAIVERHVVNQGKSEALNTVFRLARDLGVGTLVVLDGDGQHRAAEIHRVLAPVLAGEADVVIGSRFLAASAGDVPAVRRMGQAAMTTATNVVSGTVVTDSQSGFRAFSRRAIEALLFSSRGFSVEVEMQFHAAERGLRIVEMPITAVYLDPPKRNVFSQGMQVLNGVLQLAGRYRPLLFFGVPGMVLLAVGMIFGVIVAETYRTTQVLAVGYGLITVLCLIMGLLAIFTGLLLHSIRGAFLDLDRRVASLAAGHYTTSGILEN